MDIYFDNITAEPVPLPAEKGISACVLRLDKIHPVISGNKWFKLHYYLDEAIAQHKKGIITFGGAWSNHIVATAAACQMNGLTSVGIIRGEEPHTLSKTLEQAREYGMKLCYVDRENYRKKNIPAEWQKDEFDIIDEGGYGTKGAAGATEILGYSDRNFTHCCCAVGTGTMIAGLINAILPGQKVIGISVMKSNTDLEKNVQSLLVDGPQEWQIIHHYHFGGYAKYQPELLSFMNEFYSRTKIPSDFVYTGKLFFAINELINSNFFPRGSKLLLIHSGGLQGNLSLEKGTLIY